MDLPTSLISGTLIRRYKRFLADVRLDNGEVVTAHCPNTGSMTGCNIPDSPVLLSVSDRPGRKYPFTWELVQFDGYWVGINTAHPNRLVADGVLDGTVSELQGYGMLRREVSYGSNSRVDLLLEGEQGRCYVEVKNVTLVQEGRALFPDAVTLRGQKHLCELEQVVRDGDRGVIFFVVQRGDADSVAPADAIDREYGRLLRRAVSNGVEALAYRALVTPERIVLQQRLPVCL
jgi:sugar fermentation stimulation protein A